MKGGDKLNGKNILKGRFLTSIQLDNSSKSQFNYSDSGLFEVTINVMSEDVIANNCIFEKGSINKSIKSLFNKPILTEWIEENGKYRLGSHGGEYIMTHDSIQYNRTTFAIGTVYDNQNIKYVNIHNKNNDRIDKYLQVKAYLWNDEYSEIVDYIYKNGANQSMEVDILDYEYDDDGCLHINDFKFTALCALNRDDDDNLNVLPAFELADIVATSKTNENAINHHEQLDIKDYNDRNFEKYFSEYLAKIDNKINLLFKQDDKKEVENQRGEEMELKDFKLDDIVADERVKQYIEDEKKIVTDEIVEKYSEIIVTKDLEISETKEKYGNYDELVGKLAEYELQERLDNFDKYVQDNFTNIPSDNEVLLSLKEQVSKNELKLDDELLDLKLTKIDYELMKAMAEVQDEKIVDEIEKIEDVEDEVDKHDEKAIENDNEEVKSFSNAGVVVPKKINKKETSKLAIQDCYK